MRPLARSPLMARSVPSASLITKGRLGSLEHQTPEGSDASHVRP